MERRNDIFVAGLRIRVVDIAIFRQLTLQNLPKFPNNLLLNRRRPTGKFGREITFLRNDDDSFRVNSPRRRMPSRHRRRTAMMMTVKKMQSVE